MLAICKHTIKQQKFARTAKLFAMAAAVSFISACSDGKKSNSNSASTAGSTASNAAVLAKINADFAHAQGITGAGVKIAVIDTGLNTDLAEFIGINTTGSKSVVTNASDVSDQNGHGTAVTSIIAAARDNTGMTGISFNSDILAIKADGPVGSFTAARLRMAIDYAIQQNADIVNMSIAGPSAPSVGFVASLENAVDNGMLMVMASGNRGVDNPDYPARYAGTFNGTGEVISVGSVDSNNIISSFSNKAGISKDFFMVAPGESVSTVDASGNLVSQNGTSFAAPLVAGAAALIKQNAPHLTGNEIAQILLQTAKDLGAVGVDEVYGHGLLDVEAALTPYGSAYIPAGVQTGSGSGSASTNVVFDPAFSSALLNNATLQSTMVLDEYDRAYTLNLTNQVQQHNTNMDMQNWMQLDPVDSMESQRLGNDTQLSHGLAPAKWADAGQVNTNGGFVSLTSVISDKTEVEASVGLPLSAHLGVAAMDKDAGKAIRQINARHAMENPYLSYAGGDLGVSAQRQISNNLSVRAGYGLSTGTALTAATQSLRTGSMQMVTALEADYRFSPKFRMSFNAGQMLETGSLLNSYGAGAFAFGGTSTTNFAGAAAQLKLQQNLSLFANYNRGYTNAGNKGAGLIRSVSNLQSEAFSVGLVASQTRLLRMISKNSKLKDSLSFSVSQPLRIVSGVATLDVPTARDIHGNITRVTDSVSLEPTGRQIDAEINYSIALGGANGSTSSLGIIAGLTRHQNHDASSDIVTNVGLKVHKKF